MTRLENGAETGLADGTVVTTTNSDDNGAGAAVTLVAGSPTFSTLTPVRGTLCFRTAIGTSGNTYIRWASGLAGTTMAARAYFIIESNALTGNTIVARLLNGSNAAMAQLRLSSTLVPTILNGAGGVAVVGGVALELETPYRLEAWVTPGTTTSTGRIDFRLYEGHDESTPLVQWASTAASNGTATTPRSMELGRSSTAAGAITIRWDDLALDDGIGETFIGPSVKDLSLTGTADAVSDASGELSARRPLTGTATAVSGASGTIGTADFALTGTAATTSGASGVISARRPLTGVAAAASGASGTISARRPLAGVAASVSDALGTISARRQLSGTVTAVSSALGTIGLLGEGGARIYFRGDRIGAAYHLGELVTLR